MTDPVKLGKLPQMEDKPYLGIPFQCQKCRAVWDKGQGEYPCPICLYDGKLLDPQKRFKLQAILDENGEFASTHLDISDLSRRDFEFIIFELEQLKLTLFNVLERHAKETKEENH